MKTSTLTQENIFAKKRKLCIYDLPSEQFAGKSVHINTFLINKYMTK